MTDEKFPLMTPDITISAREVFDVDFDMEVPAFSKTSEYVPEIDDAYIFDDRTTQAILAGFAYDRRVMVQGYHGTGKSTHIEQIAARLNWPMVRINLDSHVSRIDLIGKDAIVLKDGKQITEFREGLLPWALQNPVALTFDEYDAGRPDVMFVKGFAFSPRRTRSALAIRRGSIMEHSKSTKAKWTVGQLCAS